MEAEISRQPAQSAATQGATEKNRAYPSALSPAVSGSTVITADGTAAHFVTVGKFAETALGSRGIGPETVARLQIYTGSTRKSDIGETSVVPDTDGNIVVFPFIHRGKTVGAKYRAAGKKFWQSKGGYKTFWNSDVLDDPAVENHPVIITEGEIDALISIDCGFPLTMSVPDGAPPVPEGEDPDRPKDEDQNDESGKFSFMWNNRDRLKNVHRFIIATDADAPGRRLAAELVRRLSAARCMFVTYPDNCKDLSDVERLYGRDALVQCINSAKPYPVKGVYQLSDYPDAEEPTTYGTGWPQLQDHLKLWLGEMLVVTGIPGHGKSTWVMNLCTNMAINYGFVTAVASFEIPTVPSLRHKLRLAVGGIPVSEWTHQKVKDADAFIQNQFVFISDEPGGGDDDLTLEWLLDRATDAVMRYGIKILVIDPWNEVEHSRPRNESETQYVNRALHQIRRFGLQYKVLTIVVAHPTKEVGKGGAIRPPSLYDIEGSAAWFNKPDHGIVVHVDPATPSITDIYVNKCRFNWSGKKGQCSLRYIPEIEGYGAL